MSITPFLPTIANVVKASAAWPNGAAVAIPPGVSLASLAFRVTGTFGGATVTPKLQGSIDGVNWTDIAGATVTGQTASTAAGTALFASGTGNLIDLSPWPYVRTVVTEAAGPATDGIYVETAIYAQNAGG